MIGTRHQPIHPSQENSDAVPSLTSPETPRGPRAPAPTVRLAGSIAPVSTRLPTAFEVAAGGTPRPFRARNRTQPPRSKLVAGDDGAADELAAIWNRRGIHREEEDENENA